MGVSTQEAPCSDWKHQGRLSEEMRSLLSSWLRLPSEELPKYFVFIFVTVCCIFGRRQRGHLYPMQLVANNKAQLKTALNIQGQTKILADSVPNILFHGSEKYRHNRLQTQSDHDSGFGPVCLSSQLSLPYVSVILGQVSFIIAKWQSQFQASQGHATLSRTKGCF